MLTAKAPAAAAQAVFWLELEAATPANLAGALILRDASDAIADVRYHRQDPRWGVLVRLRVAVQRLTIGRIEAIRIARPLHPPQPALVSRPLCRQRE